MGNRYGQQLIVHGFCPKTMAKQLLTLAIPLCATVSTLSHDSASNLMLSHVTQRVAMVAQTVEYGVNNRRGHVLLDKNHGQVDC